MAGVSCSILKSDVIVAGSGGAGAMAALAAAQAGAKVLLLTSNAVGRGGLTPTGNGGYLAPLDPKDDPDDLFRFLVKFGYYLNDQNLVRALVTEAIPGLKRLEAFGLNVRWPPGRDEGPFPRTILVPGTEVLGVLRRALYSHPAIQVIEDVVVTKLIAHDGSVTGCAAHDARSGRFFVSSSKAFILATGGMGEAWSEGSNKPMGITTGSYGSGYALAADVGAELVDMEQIQFVPVPAMPRIARNVRYLPNGPFVNSEGEQFLGTELDPYSVELVMAIRAQEQRGRGPVYVDLTGSGRPSFPISHPLYERKIRTFEDMGVAPWQEPVQVRIGSHYCQGGVHIDEDCATSIPGFFAAGEAAGGVMGACRAGGAAFTDIIVLGWRAGLAAAKYAEGRRRQPPSPSPTESALGVTGIHSASKGKTKPSEFVRELNRLMDEGCGVVRDGPGLENCLRGIQALEGSLRDMAVPPPGVFDLRFQDALSVGPMLHAAEMVVRSAIARTETLGCHVRSDCPNRPTWPVHSTIRRVGREYVLGTKPVVVKWLRPSE